MAEEAPPGSGADMGSVSAHYAALLRTHGPTPAGVGWRNDERQQERFRQLTSCIDRRGDFSVLDVGCGYGALFDHIAQDGRNFTYMGTDVAPQMIEQARLLHPDISACAFVTTSIPESSFDYVFASGIFNVVRAPSEGAWEEYTFQTMRQMFSRTRKVMACNFLTAYCDPERKEQGLYYADPGRILDFCIRYLSRNMTLAHHYGTWDFTIQVSRDEV
jgi:SAM-dependent methyltransferase